MASGSEEPGALAFSWAYLGMCVFVGFLSAASLPLGSLLGLQWQPNSVITGVMEAFGGGERPQRSLSSSLARGFWLET